MSNALVKRGYHQAKKLLLIQVILIVTLSSLGLFQEFKIAVALLSGAIAVLIANFYFVYKVFSKSGAQASKQVVRAFYFGETIKILISVSLLTIAFAQQPGSEMYVLVGYIAAHLLQWLTPMIVKTH